MIVYCYKVNVSCTSYETAKDKDGKYFDVVEGTFFTIAESVEEVGKEWPEALSIIRMGIAYMTTLEYTVTNPLPQMERRIGQQDPIGFEETPSDWREEARLSILRDIAEEPCTSAERDNTNIECPSILFDCKEGWCPPCLARDVLERTK